MQHEHIVELEQYVVHYRYGSLDLTIRHISSNVVAYLRKFGARCHILFFKKITNTTRFSTLFKLKFSFCHNSQFIKIFKICHTVTSVHLCPYFLFGAQNFPNWTLTTKKEKKRPRSTIQNYFKLLIMSLAWIPWDRVSVVELKLPADLSRKLQLKIRPEHLHFFIVNHFDAG